MQAWQMINNSNCCSETFQALMQSRVPLTGGKFLDQLSSSA